jgi:gamma-glutamyltranspeptidase/glutathione hydrolase
MHLDECRYRSELNPMTEVPNSLRLDRRTFLTTSGCALAGLAANRSFGASPPSKNGGLIVGHPEGGKAGMAVLAEGGNAVDAVVAGALVAGVVAVSRCGIGGYGGHMTIGLPNGKVTCIDFNSEAPAAARPDMFAHKDKDAVNYNGNHTGWKAAGVPGTMAGLQLALDKYGSKPFARLVEPAIRYARDGFAVYWPTPASLGRDPGSAKLFFRNGKPLQKGATYRNPDLADLLQHFAEKGTANDFYQGETARRIAGAFRKNGGLVTARDLANYRAIELAPLQLEWRDHTIFTAPLTAGGLTFLQIIATYKKLDDLLQQFPVGNPTRTQAKLEAMRIAWGDRLRLFGDPRQIDVPIDRLLSDKYAHESADKVRTAITNKRPAPVSSDARTADGTLNLTAVDGNGMMACLTMTHGDSFGAQVTVDGLGLVLGHGMSRFDPMPGRPNSVVPGKRPLDNMSPTIVLRDGKPMLAIGAVGGRRIVNAVLQVLTNLIAEGRNLEQAVSDPHIHTEGDLNVYLEPGRPESEIKALKQFGYTVRGPKMSWVAAVQIDPAANGRVLGISDGPPKDGKGARDPHPEVIHARSV